MSLVKITKAGRGSSVSGSVSRILPAVLIDKFFLVGALAGFFGSIALGAYVWLIRSGLLPVDARYHSLRELHAVMQFYLFMTPFILGFLIQSAQKLFESPTALSRFTHFALPVTVVSAIAILIAPGTFLVSTLLASGIWSVAISMFPMLLRSTWPIRLRFGGFAMFGLLSLGTGAFFDLGVPLKALALFWLGIVPIIFATAQQFIAGVLGGKQPSPHASLITIALFVATGIAIVLSAVSQMVALLSAALAALTFLSFLSSTRIWKGWRHLREPIGITFACAHIWALTGALMLWQGAAHADSVLHVWGIGYALTLIIGISIRLISWITETQPMSPRLQIFLLLTWQIVPFVRGLQVLVPFPRFAVWISSACALAVLATWAASISTSVYSAISLQLQARRRALLQHRSP